MPASCCRAATAACPCACPSVLCSSKKGKYLGLSQRSREKLPSSSRQTWAATTFSCRKFLMFFPRDWPRTVTRPIGTDDWPEEQLALCLRALLLGKRRVSFSFQRLHPEAVPCVLEHLWGGQTGRSRQMYVCGGEE